VGVGEACPCGPNYMEAHAGGMLPALKELAPALAGVNPAEPLVVMHRMNHALKGHSVAKAAIDLACWDLLGKASDQPCYRLLGGAMLDAVPLHRVVPLGSPEQTVNRVEALKQQGYRQFQIKAGQAVDDDIAVMRAVSHGCDSGDVFMVDANTAWRRDQAVQFSRALADVNFFLEQPCPDLESCLSVRRRCSHPIKLDEALISLTEVRQAIAADAMDAMALKITRYAGLTVSRMVRDLCADAGIAMTIEDAWGSGVTTAAVAHLAISTPPEVLLNATDLHRYNTTPLSTGAPTVDQGVMTVSDRPGLGVEPDWAQLKRPVFNYTY